MALESQKRIGGTSMPPFISRYPEVFETLFGTLGPRGWIYVALMELRGQPLAFQLGFRCGKKLWFYQTAYDHAFARLSPGTMLIPAVLDYGFARGYDEYDFLTGDESYKATWCSDSHETFRVEIWNGRVTSWAYRAWVTAARLMGPRT
jgi:CelD/BcsL family acetyltransferase involved in cellulose biosynthesis